MLSANLTFYISLLLSTYLPTYLLPQLPPFPIPWRSLICPSSPTPDILLILALPTAVKTQNRNIYHAQHALHSTLASHPRLECSRAAGRMRVRSPEEPRAQLNAIRGDKLCGCMEWRCAGDAVLCGYRWVWDGHGRMRS